MAPRVKRKYISSNNSNEIISNRRRSISLYDHQHESSMKDPPSASLLKSYKTASSRTFRNQQIQQVQLMQNNLQARERTILQNITNLKLNSNATGLKRTNPKKETINEPVLPNDINDFNNPEDFPSFIASPIILKEASFRFDAQIDDSFIDQSKLKEEDWSAIGVEDEIADKLHSSSSPNKVPVAVSSDINSECNQFHDSYQVTMNRACDSNEDNNLSHCSKSSQAFASPISEKSISRPEIDFFTVDSEFLRSFEGIWQRKLEYPVMTADPESPDHFSQIPMVSKGARKRIMK